MQMAGFISAYTSLYVREFNAHTGRTGPLFEPLYGSAMKMEMKKIRSAIIYMFNNAVEKRLCPKAEDYRWNFLKYYNPEKTSPIRRKKDLSVMKSLEIWVALLQADTQDLKLEGKQLIKLKICSYRILHYSILLMKK